MYVSTLFVYTFKKGPIVTYYVDTLKKDHICRKETFKSKLPVVDFCKESVYNLHIYVLYITRYNTQISPNYINLLSYLAV